MATKTGTKPRETKTVSKDAPNWKSLAIKRRLDLKEHKKWLEETKEARSKWKQKAIKHNQRANNLEKQLKKIKKKIENILKE